METIKWKGDSVVLLDQRLLPLKEVYHTYNNYQDVINSIKEMEIRGAPAIGVAAAMGVALAAKNIRTDFSNKIEEFKKKLLEIIDLFAKTRPTAVNLFWALDLMKKIIEKEEVVSEIIRLLEKEALKIYQNDLEANKKLGQNGSKFIDDGDVILTHCNAGALATAGYGTALGVIRSAVENNKKIEVYASETRPFLQGARLTAWELLKDKIPTTVITDNMAGHFMQMGIIKKIIVGADRIAFNGDTANKIGTYSLSVLAKEHKIPFYVAAPFSTLDPKIKSGQDITIEERNVDEVAYIKSELIVPEGIKIKNPAFDVTPAKNITAIITEKGVIDNPKDNGIEWVLGN